MGGHVVTAVIRNTAGLLATLLPARVWPTLNVRGIPTFPALSPFITLSAAAIVGLPLFLNHLLVSAYEAQRVAAVAASRLPRRPGEEAVIAAAQTVSAISTLSFVGTPAGFAVVYVTLSSAGRLLGAYLGDPGGDPLIVLADWVWRRCAKGFSASFSRIELRLRFGREEADIVVAASEHDVVGADLVVITARPKAGWTAGTLILSDRRYFQILEPIERVIGTHRRILYPLKRKHDFDIIRKALRYEIPTG